jgi:phosphoglycolate phosphatase
LLMPIRLLMFDLDGTLVDTCRDITNALNYALNSYGLQGLTVEDTKKLVGEGLTKLVEKVLGGDKDRLRDDVLGKFLDYYREHIADYSCEYPYVRDTLEMLTGYKKAVISNKRESLSTRLLDLLDILKYFDLVVGSDTTSEKKPSAIPVIYVLQRLEVSAADALMIGDSNYDIEAARKAGVKTIAVTYGYRGRQYLADADFMIDSFGDLPAVLDITSSQLI